MIYSVFSTMVIPDLRDLFFCCLRVYRKWLSGVTAPDPGEIKSDAGAASSSDATLPFCVQRHR